MPKLLATLTSMALIGSAIAACDTAARPCDAVYTAQRCRALAASAAKAARIDPSEVVGLEILPSPTSPPGITSTIGPPMLLRLYTAQHGRKDVKLYCGVAGPPGCPSDPTSLTSAVPD
jgi:hypothetical protein